MSGIRFDSMNYPCVNDLNGNAIDIFVDTLYQKEDTIHHRFFDDFTTITIMRVLTLLDTFKELYPVGYIGLKYT